MCCSDVGMEVPNEDTTPIGVAAFGIDEKRNKIDLSASQGLTATLMLWAPVASIE